MGRGRQEGSSPASSVNTWVGGGVGTKVEKVKESRFEEDGRIRGLRFGHGYFEMFPKMILWEQMTMRCTRRFNLKRRLLLKGKKNRKPLF